MIRVMLVEDEPIVRRGIAKILRENQPGFLVIAEYSSAEACLDAKDFSTVDLIITDIRMPGRDGMELIETLRSQNPDLKFIIISGYDDFQYCRKAIKNEVYDYILKPLDKSDFLSTLTRFRQTFDLGSGAQAKAEPPAPADRSVIRDIKEHIRARYRESISLSDLSRLYFLNPSYVSTLFKKETGTTITEYLAWIRVEKAKVLLKDRNMTVEAVASAVGYGSPKHFSLIFKRINGNTPSEFRNS